MRGNIPGDIANMSFSRSGVVRAGNLITCVTCWPGVLIDMMRLADFIGDTGSGYCLKGVSVYSCNSMLRLLLNLSNGLVFA